MKRFELAVFDLDGTLIDNRFAIRKNFNYARGLHGHEPLPDHKIDSMIGSSLLKMFEKTLRKPDKYLAPAMENEYRKRYRTTSHEGVVILDSVISTLEYLVKEGFKLAVATSKADAEAHVLLQKIDLYKYFDFVTGFRDGIRTKPDPDMIQYIMKELDTIYNERT
ncbi:MAG: HAD family hydrolase [Candidatus Aenigmarchaeota archaeon]|nr:HAD family hydrolase [Candidatus Aenigmarchaeota archaeon]MDI6722876.1 HAD family hydrolase [Candidatus Aenigmarchaeota archaeon]